MKLDAENHAFAVAGKGLRPLLLYAGEAHCSVTVSYEGNGTLLLQHTTVGSIRIPRDRQFPCVRATFVGYCSLHAAINSLSRERFFAPFGVSGVFSFSWSGIVENPRSKMAEARVRKVIAHPPYCSAPHGSI